MSKRVIPADEQRVDIKFWARDGQLLWHKGQGEGRSEVSIGRTDSKRGLGFVLSNGSEFVLDRSQVENLHAFLAFQIPRLKPMAWPPDALKMTSGRASRRKGGGMRRGAR